MQGYPIASSTWDKEELKAIQEVIKNDHFTMGEKVAEFEKAFADFVGSKYAVMTSSGSTALKHRRENAKLFCEFFGNHSGFIIQKEIGLSSWFGFSFIIKETSKLKREEILKKLSANGIDYRPICAGDFTQNEVIKYFDYEIFGELKNAKYLQNGFFVGNHQVDISKELRLLYQVIGGDLANPCALKQPLEQSSKAA